MCNICTLKQLSVLRPSPRGIRSSSVGNSIQLTKCWKLLKNEIRSKLTSICTKNSGILTADIMLSSNCSSFKIKCRKTCNSSRDNAVIWGASDLKRARGPRPARTASTVAKFLGGPSLTVKMLTWTLFSYKTIAFHSFQTDRVKKCFFSDSIFSDFNLQYWRSW